MRVCGGIKRILRDSRGPVGPTAREVRGPRDQGAGGETPEPLAQAGDAGPHRAAQGQRGHTARRRDRVQAEARQAPRCASRGLCEDTDPLGPVTGASPNHGVSKHFPCPWEAQTPYEVTAHIASRASRSAPRPTGR